jgi:hypothetical protein
VVDAPTLESGFEAAALTGHRTPRRQMARAGAAHTTSLAARIDDASCVNRIESRVVEDLAPRQCGVQPRTFDEAVEPSRSVSAKRSGSELTGTKGVLGPDDHHTPVGA